MQSREALTETCSTRCSQVPRPHQAPHWVLTWCAWTLTQSISNLVTPLSLLYYRNSSLLWKTGIWDECRIIRETDYKIKRSYTGQYVYNNVSGMFKEQETHYILILSWLYLHLISIVFIIPNYKHIFSICMFSILNIS